MTLFGGTGVATVDKERDFQDKLYYTAQVLVARKFGERLSLQLSPTYLYRTMPDVTGDEKVLFAVGIGGRFKLSKRVSLNGEYFYTAREKNTVTAPYHDSMSFGVDIETGGHVFQLHFTNSLGMIEKQFIGETTGSWGKGISITGSTFPVLSALTRRTRSSQTDPDYETAFYRVACLAMFSTALLSGTAFAQMFATSGGNTQFSASTPLENIEAENKKSQGDPEHGQQRDRDPDEHAGVFFSQ